MSESYLGFLCIIKGEIMEKIKGNCNQIEDLESKTRFSKRLIIGLATTSAVLGLMTGCDNNSTKNTSDREIGTEQVEMTPREEAQAGNYETLEIYAGIEKNDLSIEVQEYVDDLTDSADIVNLILDNLEDDDQSDKNAVIKLLESQVTNQEIAINVEVATEKFLSEYKIDGLTPEQQEKYNTLMNLSVDEFYDFNKVSAESMGWFIKTTLDQSRSRLEQKGKDFSRYDEILADRTERKNLGAKEAVEIENDNLLIALNAGVFDVDGTTINLPDNFTKKTLQYAYFGIFGNSNNDIEEVYVDVDVKRQALGWTWLVDSIMEDDDYSKDGMIEFQLEYDSATGATVPTKSSRLFGESLEMIGIALKPDKDKGTVMPLSSGRFVLNFDDNSYSQGREIHLYQEPKL